MRHKRTENPLTRPEMLNLIRSSGKLAGRFDLPYEEKAMESVYLYQHVLDPKAILMQFSLGYGEGYKALQQSDEPIVWKKREYRDAIANPVQYGQLGYELEGLVRGEPTILYHGTTATFSTFDIDKAREDLVNQFYGNGIFLTPSKLVAESYAEANRNIGLPAEVIDDLQTVNPEAGAFLRDLYASGEKAWDRVRDVTDFENRTGIDPNSINDIADYVIGSRCIPVQYMSDDPGFVNIFETRTGAPSWLYDTLDEVGLDSDLYRPKIYIVQVRLNNPLVTASKVKASQARFMGYDSVLYYGDDLVMDVPEVAVFDSDLVEILKVEVLRPEYTE